MGVSTDANVSTVSALLDDIRLATMKYHLAIALILGEDVSQHDGEDNLKIRRWDQKGTGL